MWPVVQTFILIWTKFKEQQFFLRIHSLKPRGNIVFYQHIPLPSFTICPFSFSLASLMSFHGLSYSQSVLNRALSSQEFVTGTAAITHDWLGLKTTTRQNNAGKKSVKARRKSQEPCKLCLICSIILSGSR